MHVMRELRFAKGGSNTIRLFYPKMHTTDNQIVPLLYSCPLTPPHPHFPWGISWMKNKEGLEQYQNPGKTERSAIPLGRFAISLSSDSLFFLILSSSTITKT